MRSDLRSHPSTCTGPALSIGSALPALLLSDIQEAQGFYFITLVNSIFYSLVTLTILFKHAQENRTFQPRVGSGLKYEGMRLLIIVAVVVAPSYALPLRPRAASAIIAGMEELLPSVGLPRAYSNER
jgi:cellulose synthase (UDP-forming)